MQAGCAENALFSKKFRKRNEVRTKQKQLVTVIFEAALQPWQKKRRTKMKLLLSCT